MISKVELISAGAPKGCHAVPSGTPFQISLKVIGAHCDKLFFYLGNDERVIIEKEIPFVNQAPVNEQGFYGDVTLSSTDIGMDDGLFFCHFEFEQGGSRHYIAFDHNENAYVSPRFVNELQIIIYNEQYASPNWLFGGAMYQIFPDRFAKGGEVSRREDAVYDEDWDNGIPEYPAQVGQAFPNNKHFGGTLYGIADRLSYLSGLGINCIYLNPIFSAFSNHKYDTADFLSVDKTFGGDKALEYLVEKAHSVGIRVILDGVFNHVGNDSIYFDAYGKYGTGACVSTQSPYYNWFKFFNYPNEYDSWWGITNLPKIIPNESYITFITEKVIPKYMNMGIDGWRLDVADELNSDFLDRVAKAIKSCKPDAIIIGEVWEDASNKIAYNERKRYFRGAQLDAVTNYPFRNSVIEFFKYGCGEFLVDTVNTLYRHYPPHKLASLMNFLGSHDTERIATVLCGDPDMGDENEVLAHRRMTAQQRIEAKEMLQNAYLLLAALPGVPCLYYGDEIALEGYHDPFNRRPFPTKGFSDPYSAFFGRVNKLRREEKLFNADELKASCLGDRQIRIDRIMGDEIMTVFANMAEYDFNVNMPYQSVDLLTGAVYTDKVIIPAKKVVLVKKKI